MVNESDHDDARVAIVLASLAEVVRALAEYRDHVLLVGGWVPRFLMPRAAERHCGSLDIDLAVDHVGIDDEGYRRIGELLAHVGFRPETGQPHRFVRDSMAKGTSVTVCVDLLAAEYGGSGGKRRHQQVQDVEARKARGCDLAFRHPVEVRVEMTLPDGAVSDVSLRVANVAAFIVMKAFALGGRRKSKDAYDIVYCLEQHPGGVQGVVAAFESLGSHGLVRESIGVLADAFRTVRHEGSVAVAEFRGLAIGEERDLVIRRAYEVVNELVARVGHGEP
ncbi:MAG: hypothetical protein RL689_436 [Planctomycetota bacterium]|jgi:hypothetical protein